MKIKCFYVCWQCCDNDLCLRNLKDNLSLSTKLVLNGDLSHVRCAYILNLLVQDGLSKIWDIVHNVRESVKYINYTNSRWKALWDVGQKHQKRKKKNLIIDCLTRWIVQFKCCWLHWSSKFHFQPIVKETYIIHIHFYMKIEEKYKKFCKLLVFNIATHIISVNKYFTTNLYLGVL